jgi:hypothetical protein
MISTRWNNYKHSLISGGGGKNAGFVRRMEAEKKIQFNKITNPSKFMINKYGQSVPIEDYDDLAHDDNYTPVTTPLSRFDDYHVGKPKKKHNKERNRLTEVQEEQLENERRQKELEKDKIRQHFETLKQMVTDYKRQYGVLWTQYTKQLDELKSKRGVSKQKKSDLQEELIVNNHKNINKLKSSFPKLFEYMKQNKLVDINLVFKHINNNSKKA